MPEKSEAPEALVATVRSGRARVRFAAIKALRILSERAPDAIYQHFDFFESLLRDENSILRWNAALILGNLAIADSAGRLDRILDEYLAPISGSRLIDAANTMRGAAAIAAAKPRLADRIAARVLTVERAEYANPECRNVAIGHAINALDGLFPAVTDKCSVQLFVSRQLENHRPATRKKAERFMRRWPMHGRT